MSANDLRKTMDLLNEAAPVEKATKPNTNNVKVNLETLARSAGSKGRYNFNKGFLTFQDVLDGPSPFITQYRKTRVVDATRLMTLLDGMQPQEKYTDKSHYLRVGYEARGFSNGKVVLVWFKEKGESLIIFTQNKQDHMDVRDFLEFCQVIRSN